MSKRAADDFASIRVRLRELSAIPTPKRSGSYFDHCAHCPKDPNERCDLGCTAEGKNAGVV